MKKQRACLEVYWALPKPRQKQDKINLKSHLMMMDTTPFQWLTSKYKQNKTFQVQVFGLSSGSSGHE
jgi:hypothetical protein